MYYTDIRYTVPLYHSLSTISSPQTNLGWPKMLTYLGAPGHSGHILSLCTYHGHCLLAGPTSTFFAAPNLDLRYDVAEWLDHSGPFCLVLWRHVFTVFVHIYIYWECHDPNWRSPSFFRGVGSTTVTSFDSLDSLDRLVWIMLPFCLAPTSSKLRLYNIYIHIIYSINVCYVCIYVYVYIYMYIHINV